VDNPYQTPAAEPPPLPEFRQGGFRPVRRLATVSVALYAASGVLELLDHMYRALLAKRHAAINPEFDTVAREVGILEITMLVTGLAAAITYLVWKYRAAVNARIIDRDTMTISPAMAVGSYFLPVVNLVIPYRAMAGIAGASGIRHGLVAAWWAAQLGTIAVSVVSIMIDDIDARLPPSWIEHVYIVMSLLSLIISSQLVWVITRSQEQERAREI
jgi:hypothetical protein